MGVIETNHAGLSPRVQANKINPYRSDLDGLLHRCLFSVPGGQARSLTDGGFAKRSLWGSLSLLKREELGISKKEEERKSDRGQERKRKGHLHDPVVVPRYDHSRYNMI